MASNFPLSFGNTVAFEHFHPDVQKQTGRFVEHSGLKWKLYLYRASESGAHDVSIHVEKIGGGAFSAEFEYSSPISGHRLATFDDENQEKVIGTIANTTQLDSFVCSVYILEVKEIEPEAPHFDFSMANPDLHTDVVLVVEDKEFHVNKTFLATFSTYFKNLFFRDYLESTQPRIPILGVKAAGFQKLLQFIHQKTDITARNISLLLETSTFFDMEDVKKRCEKAAMRMVWVDLKPKETIILAEKFALNELMTHTLASLFTTEQVQDALPDEDLSAPTMKRLLEKLSSVRKRTGRHLGHPEDRENQNFNQRFQGPAQRGPAGQMRQVGMPGYRVVANRFGN